MTSAQDTSPPIFCPHCSVELPAGATECSHCHAPLAAADHGTGTAPKQDSLSRYLDKPGVILGILFFVTAGMGIPFLWKSKAFGWIGKTVLTLIMIPYTAVILWAIYLLLMSIYSDFQDLLQSW